VAAANYDHIERLAHPDHTALSSSPLAQSINRTPGGVVDRIALRKAEYRRLVRQGQARKYERRSTKYE
jgi:hypothetical protein